MNTAYVDALRELEEVVATHRRIYKEYHIGLSTWHEACQSTWECIQKAIANVEKTQTATA